MRVRLISLAGFAAFVVFVVAAQAQTTPTAKLTGATLSSTWKESWLTGSVRFSGVVTGPATLRVSLRPRAGGPPAAAVTLPLDQAGTFGGEWAGSGEGVSLGDGVAGISTPEGDAPLGDVGHAPEDRLRPVSGRLGMAAE